MAARLENIAQRPQNAHGVFIANPIEDALRFPPGRKQPGLPQLGKVLGGRRLGQTDVLGEVGHRAFAFHQLAQDQQPLLVRQLFKQLRRAMRAVAQGIDLISQQAAGHNRFGGGHKRMIGEIGWQAQSLFTLGWKVEATRS